MTKTKHAVILDDHQLFADSFSVLLEKYGLFAEINTFNAVDDLIAFLVASGRKEVYIFLDYYLKEKNGLSLFPEIKRLNRHAKVIFVTSAISPTVLQNILVSKPHGIISKFCDIATLIECVKHIDAKQPFLDGHIREILEAQRQSTISFTPRELELLSYFANGLGIAETAERISLSRHTIITHRRKMMAKANCHSIGQLVKYAQDHDLI